MLGIFSRNLCKDYFFKIGILSAKVYAKIFKKNPTLPKKGNKFHIDKIITTKLIEIYF